MFYFCFHLDTRHHSPDMSKRWPIGVTCMKLSLRARNSCSSFGVVLILSILDGGEYVRTKMTGTALKNPFGKNFGRCADSHNVVNLEHGRILTFEEAMRICTTASTICLLLPHGRSKKIAEVHHCLLPPCLQPALSRRSRGNAGQAGLRNHFMEALKRPCCGGLPSNVDQLGSPASH